MRKQLQDQSLSETQRERIVKEYVEEIGRREQKMIEYAAQSMIHPRLETQR